MEIFFDTLLTTDQNELITAALAIARKAALQSQSKAAKDFLAQYHHSQDCALQEHTRGRSPRHIPWVTCEGESTRFVRITLVIETHYPGTATIPRKGSQGKTRAISIIYSFAIKRG